jgi:glycosyltransferase involved in cell wall biosynthesis
VTYTGDPNNEGVTFAQQLGATVVEPPDVDRDLDTEELQNALAVAEGLTTDSGLIFVSNPDRRIDFEQTRERLDGAQRCEAVYETETGAVHPNAEIVVGIPAYNEEETIAAVVTAANKYADSVLVVDDGSDDGTSAVAEDAGATVVEHSLNQGYGAALQTLFTEANKYDIDHLVIIDADGQHDPSDIPKLVEQQQDAETELVIGSRFTDEGRTDAPLYRRFGLKVINTLTNVSMGVVRPSATVSDTQSGFRAYSSDAIASLADDESLGEGMSASTDILYHAHSNSFDIEEVGTDVSYDVENASNRNPLSHGITLVSNILRTIESERPILVLGLPGFISTLVGLYFGYWTISNYFETGIFPSGLALSAAIFGLTGIFALFTSIILHALNQHLDE